MREKVARKREVKRRTEGRDEDRERRKKRERRKEKGEEIDKRERVDCTPKCLLIPKMSSQFLYNIFNGVIWLTETMLRNEHATHTIAKALIPIKLFKKSKYVTKRVKSKNYKNLYQTNDLWWSTPLLYLILILLMPAGKNGIYTLQRQALIRAMKK